MVRITPDQVNAVVVTLTEVGTASHYLFGFRCEATGLTTYTIADDLSLWPDRYNSFSITEVASAADPTASEVTMRPSGQWYYYVWANTNATNIDPDGLTLLEQGMAIVEPVTSGVPSIPTFAGASNTVAVHGA